MRNIRLNPEEYKSHIFASNIFKKNNLELSIGYIEGNCEFCFGFTLDDIKSNSRVRNLVMARQIFHYLIWAFCDKGKSYIGEKYNRGHSSVIYSIISVEDFYSFDSLYTNRFNDVINKLSK